MGLTTVGCETPAAEQFWGLPNAYRVGSNKCRLAGASRRAPAVGRSTMR